MASLTLVKNTCEYKVDLKHYAERHVHECGRWVRQARLRIIITEALFGSTSVSEISNLATGNIETQDFKTRREGEHDSFLRTLCPELKSALQHIWHS